MKGQEDVLPLFLHSGQEGLRKQLLGLRQVTLQSFFSITHCPSTLSLPQPGPYHPSRTNFLLIPNLNLPFFGLKPFSLVLSPRTLITSSLLVCVDLWAAGSSSLSKHPWCVPQEHRSGHTGSHLQPGTFSPASPGLQGDKLSSHLGRRDLSLSRLSCWELHFSLLLPLSFLL